MADYTPVISKITLPSGTTYYLKDSYAREQLEALVNYSKFLGVTSTAIVDGVTTSPDVTIGGNTVTATVGDIVVSGSKEFIYNGTVWQEFGDLSGLINQLGEMAYVDTASGGYLPEGTIEASFTGAEATISADAEVTGEVTAEFTGTEGDISASGTVATQDIVVNGISGTATYTPEGTLTNLTFEGAQGTISVTYTPAGSVSGSFSGTAGEVSVSGTPLGAIQIAEIVESLSGNYTPTGSVSVNVDLDVDGGSVNSITSVGTSASWALTSNTTIAAIDATDSEKLVLTWGSGLFDFTPNALPTYTETSVITGVAVSSATGTFTGNKVLISATFAGSDTTFTGSYTPSGTVNATFTGTESTITTNFTPSGSVSGSFAGTGTKLVGTFASTSVNVTGTYTPSGTISADFGSGSATFTTSYTPSGSVSATFTGSSGTVTVSPDTE